MKRKRTFELKSLKVFVSKFIIKYIILRYNNKKFARLQPQTSAHSILMLYFQNKIENSLIKGTVFILLFNWLYEF